eukprot:CAMPEP_0185620414 /NCGR_PEP_ID=MMETSP0436-20130131/53977_1 /TAXON_ID=626734 ORGANISM="Favella taraikaensis, Strain Fe Narragansett Bay" /NCGR_SAMPLE_ID=MMETSP0436 /ASSEMBLY_ACC=CAM_ASM_000390 /LENGTH=37 /DNA_ID= /DNA_START= /DNA_END= /DNA_ORIENTATION=
MEDEAFWRENLDNARRGPDILRQRLKELAEEHHKKLQ